MWQNKVQAARRSAPFLLVIYNMPIVGQATAASPSASPRTPCQHCPLSPSHGGPQPPLRHQGTPFDDIQGDLLRHRMQVPASIAVFLQCYYRYHTKSHAAWYSPSLFASPEFATTALMVAPGLGPWCWHDQDCARASSIHKIVYLLRHLEPPPSLATP
jgi:hypothetical protein